MSRGGNPQFIDAESPQPGFIKNLAVGSFLDQLRSGGGSDTVHEPQADNQRFRSPLKRHGPPQKRPADNYSFSASRNYGAYDVGSGGFNPSAYRSTTRGPATQASFDPYDEEEEDGDDGSFRGSRGYGGGPKMASLFDRPPAQMPLPPMPVPPPQSDWQRQISQAYQLGAKSAAAAKMNSFSSRPDPWNPIYARPASFSGAAEGGLFGPHRARAPLLPPTPRLEAPRMGGFGDDFYGGGGGGFGDFDRGALEAMQDAYDPFASGGNAPPWVFEDEGRDYIRSVPMAARYNPPPIPRGNFEAFDQLAMMGIQKLKGPEPVSKRQAKKEKQKQQEAEAEKEKKADEAMKEEAEEKSAADAIEVKVPPEMMSEMFCKLCDASMTSPEMSKAHYAGKKHAKKENKYIKKVYAEMDIDPSRFLAVPKGGAPPEIFDDRGVLESMHDPFPGGSVTPRMHEDDGHGHTLTGSLLEPVIRSLPRKRPHSSRSDYAAVVITVIDPRDPTVSKQLQCTRDGLLPLTTLQAAFPGAVALRLQQSDLTLGPDPRDKLIRPLDASGFGQKRYVAILEDLNKAFVRASAIGFVKRFAKVAGSSCASSAASTASSQDSRTTVNMDEAHFKHNVCDLYGSKISKSSSGIQERTCMLLNVPLPRRFIPAAHIVPKIFKDSAEVYFDFDNIWHPRNGLLLCKAVEHALDHGWLCFIANHSGDVTCRILDPSIREVDLYAYTCAVYGWNESSTGEAVSELRQYRDILESFKFGNLDGRRLHFAPGVEGRPFKRCLYASAMLNTHLAKQTGWQFNPSGSCTISDEVRSKVANWLDSNLAYLTADALPKHCSAREWLYRDRLEAAPPVPQEFYCSLCDKSMNSKKQYDQHMAGKGHFDKENTPAAYGAY